MSLENDFGLLHSQFSHPQEAALISLLWTAREMTKKGDQLFCKEPISQPQFNILLALRYESGGAGVLHKELRRWIVCTKGTLSVHVKKLKEVGLIRGKLDATDGRAERLIVTAKAKKLLARLEPEYLRQTHAVFDILSQKEIKGLVSTLGKLRKSLASQATE